MTILAHIMTVKGDGKRWNSYVTCFDDDQRLWKLQVYGDSPGESSAKAWDVYNFRDAWVLYGEIISL